MAYAWTGDRAGVVTGEAVALDLRPARTGSRAVAFGIDVVVELVVLGVLSAVATAVGTTSLDDAAGAALGLSVAVLTLVGYPVICETVWGGRTIGKSVMGLRVVRDDGGPAPFRAILLRELIGLILERPGPLVGLPAVLTSTFSERGQRIGDHWAGTLVIHTRIATPALPPLPMPPQLAYWAAAADLSRLTPAVALRARQFLARAHEFDGPAREQVGRDIAGSVAALVTPPPPPGTLGWMYVAAVLAEHRRREQWRLAVASGWRPPAYAASPPPPPPPPSSRPTGPFTLPS